MKRSHLTKNAKKMRFCEQKYVLSPLNN